MRIFIALVFLTLSTSIFWVESINAQCMKRKSVPVTLVGMPWPKCDYATERPCRKYTIELMKTSPFFFYYIDLSEIENPIGLILEVQLINWVTGDSIEVYPRGSTKGQYSWEKTNYNYNTWWTVVEKWLLLPKITTRPTLYSLKLRIRGSDVIYFTTLFQLIMKQ